MKTNVGRGAMHHARRWSTRDLASSPPDLHVLISREHQQAARAARADQPLRLAMVPPKVMLTPEKEVHRQPGRGMIEPCASAAPRTPRLEIEQHMNMPSSTHQTTIRNTPSTDVG